MNVFTIATAKILRTSTKRPTVGIKSARSLIYQPGSGGQISQHKNCVRSLSEATENATFWIGARYRQQQQQQQQQNTNNTQRNSNKQTNAHGPYQMLTFCLVFFTLVLPMHVKITILMCNFHRNILCNTWMSF